MIRRIRLLALLLLSLLTSAAGAEDWLQYKFDARNSGDAPQRIIEPDKLGMLGAVPLGDGIYTSPVVAGERIYVVDGSGTAYCIDGMTLGVVWQRETAGGRLNCNNVSSPAVAGKYLHFGTMAGYYYVLDRATGAVIKQLECRDPIFSAPAVGNGRVYFVTLGAQVYALEPNGEVAWQWDFVKEEIGFDGNRWSGEQWYKFKDGRVNWKDHFCASRNLSLSGKTVVIPAGGRTIFLEDEGDQPRLRTVAKIPSHGGSEYPAAFGQAIGEDGSVYVQWHRRDNVGRTEILRLDENDKLTTDFVPGTATAIDLPGLMSFSSVSLRGKDVYRVRPEQGLGLCRHAGTSGKENETPAPLEVLSPTPSICPPILLKDWAVYGALDGSLQVVPLAGGADAKGWSFKTRIGKPITAPPAVCDRRIIFGGEDGYLYVLAPFVNAAPPAKELEINKIRSPLTGKYTASRYNWYTNYGNMGSTNSNNQGIKPPVRLRWVRRVEGTVKHIPVCGGGRMYTHTAEGQVIAVEQETGRLLWRRYWPDVYLSFTSPLYHKEKLLIPQAGIKQSMLRCLDAATGELLWEAPFTGSPSWSRQFPPVLHENLAIYASGSGEYAASGSERPFAWQRLTKRDDNREIMSFIYTHDNPYYPQDNRPHLWAWDITTGKLVWHRDFSEYGSGGNDCGIAMMDGRLFYSTFFGYQASQRQRRGLPAGVNGLTAAIDPETGKTIWQTTDYYVTAGCTVTAKDGRLYLGGYNPAKGDTDERHIRCLDAKDGKLIWESDPVRSAVNVVTVGERFIFSNAIRAQCHLFDKETGKIIYRFGLDYNCTRFTFSEPYLMGPNLDMLDLSDGHKLVATGPAVDSRECLGSAVSNGRIYYISQASGLEMSAVCGEDAKRLAPAWEERP